MTQVAVINESKGLSDTDVAFAVAACNQHLEACARAWGLPFTPVAVYRSADPLPVTLVRVATFRDELPEAPGAAAYHTMDADGTIYSEMRADAGSVGLDHEDVEELVDPKCDQTATRPDGAVVALEVADPVQGDTRKLTVTVLGEAREVDVSNFVLPSWFRADGVAPFDAFELCTRSFEIRPGGYCVVDGVPVFGAGDEVAAKAVAAKAADPGSRLNRRMAP